MKKISTLLFLCGILIFASCSSDGGSEPEPEPEPEVVDPVITTQAPEPGTNPQILRLKGTVVEEGTYGYWRKGFCWSLNTNPTTNDQKVETDGSGEGPFFYDATFGFELELNTTYNIRAYLESNSGQTYYGNNITYTTPNIFNVSTFTVKDIYSVSATLYGIVSTNQALTSTVNHKGFCLSTSPNPTISSPIIVESTTALGDFTEEVTGLQPNTNYYVRAFAYNVNNNVIYGENLSFKTMGYVGASGGYVFYDKGETTNGWRYLEASPANLTYNASTLMKWGCTGTSIMQTSTDVGTGLENTTKILAGCNAANCAAKACADYTVNGLSDWFLPSLYEFSAMDYSLSGLVNMGDSVNQTYWTSSEYDSGNARVFNAYFSFAPGFGVSKNNNNLVRAIRRF